MLRIGIDIGGTFTDFVAWREGARAADALSSFKVSSTPPDFAEGFREGFDEMLARMRPAPDERVFVIHGTTVSTNTVIERTGAKVALMTTAGFKDILELQRLKLSRRIDMFAERTPPLVPRNLVFEIEERLLGNGAVRRAIDLAQVAAAARAAAQAGAEAFAVAFLHAFRNPAHELAARDEIRRVLGDVDVSLSSEIWPRIGEYERTIVCLLNAYVKRKMSGYIGRIEDYLSARLPNARLFLTRSNGGAMAASEARQFPVQTLLSGPASGVTAAQYLSRAIGEPKLLGMDMGGTSTDVSLVIAGRPTVSNDAEVGDFPLMMPVTGIEAIGAGGGSIARMNGAVLTVGPESAGARPGPACFGRGGTEPTLTDAYLLSGFINPDNFLGGRLALDRAAAEAAMRPVADALGVDTAAAAEACTTVATSNMVARVLPYLARHGVDPEDVTLVLYGGAGALHGPLLAAEIGIRRVLIPTLPSVFCAFGGLVSDLVNDTVATVHGTAMDAGRLRRQYEALEAEARAWLAGQVPADQLGRVWVEHWAEMRYRGQSFQLNVLLPGDAVASENMAAIEAAFHAEHERLYSHADRSAPVEFTEVRVRIHGALATPRVESLPPPAGTVEDAVCARRAIRFGGRLHAGAAIYDRARLGPGHAFAGPAVVEQVDTTIFVLPGFVARVMPSGVIVLEKGQ